MPLRAGTRLGRAPDAVVRLVARARAVSSQPELYEVPITNRAMRAVILGERARALAAFSLSLERGFIVYRILTRVDPWLDALRPTPESGQILQRAESRFRSAWAAFRDAGGEQLLGVGVPAGGV